MSAGAFKGIILAPELGVIFITADTVLSQIPYGTGRYDTGTARAYIQIFCAGFIIELYLLLITADGDDLSDVSFKLFLEPN